jgi:hypothetical protein
LKTSAPKDLKNNDHNIGVLAAYIQSYHAGLYTISSLIDAASHATGLQRVTDEEIAIKSEARQRRDYQDSLNAHKPDATRPEKKAVLDQAEAIAKVDKEIASVINGYSCTNRVGIDYATTDNRRMAMRQIAAKFGKTLKDREAALKAVKQQYYEYPS